MDVYRLFCRLEEESVCFLCQSVSTLLYVSSSAIYGSVPRFFLFFSRDAGDLALGAGIGLPLLGRKKAIAVDN